MQENEAISFKKKTLTAMKDKNATRPAKPNKALKPKRPYKSIPPGQRHTDRKNDYKRRQKHQENPAHEHADD